MKSKNITAKLDPNQYDSPWKQILDRYLPQLLFLCLPKLYYQIDWSKSYESLDQELHKIIRSSENGKRIIDKLYKVLLLNGEQIELFIHLEVQNQYDANFSARMYAGHTRIFDVRQKPLLSLAILGDDNPNWRPNHYCHGIAGFHTAINFKFDIIKLLDFKGRRDEFLASKNPFALVIVAHLTTLEKYQNAEEKLKAKTHLTRLFLEQDFSKKDILEVFAFLDWAMVLPESLEKVYNERIKQIEEVLDMRYITTPERVGLREGILIGEAKGIAMGEAKGIAMGEAKGIAIGEKEFLERLLQRKFKIKVIPTVYKKCLDNAEPTQLLEWGERLLDASHIDDIFGK